MQWNEALRHRESSAGDPLVINEQQTAMIGHLPDGYILQIVGYQQENALYAKTEAGMTRVLQEFSVNPSQGW